MTTQKALISPLRAFFIFRGTTQVFLVACVLFEQLCSLPKWFYGVKVQVLATAGGLPVAYHLHPDSKADVTGGLGQLAPDLPASSVLYTDYAHEDVFEEAIGCQQHTARRQNSKRPPAPAHTFLIQHFHHGIETCFSGLSERLPKKVHVTSAAGFALKIGLFEHFGASRQMVRWRTNVTQIQLAA